MNTRSSMVGCLVLIATGCCANEQPSRAKTWPLDGVITQPAQIEVLSGTRFRCSGIECQLLGVAESKDPKVRQKALELVQQWFKDVGNYIGIYNSDHPLRAENGTCVVWVRGYDSSLSCLNIVLVRAGLVDVDVSRWKDYAFTEPAKSGNVWIDWQGKLKKAEGEQLQSEKGKTGPTTPTK
jgi:hypothetical protein